MKEEEQKRPPFHHGLWTKQNQRKAEAGKKNDKSWLMADLIDALFLFKAEIDASFVAAFFLII